MGESGMVEATGKRKSAVRGAVVRHEKRGPVAWITVANPPVNALVQPVRAGLDRAITRALDDPETGAIVIAARGRTFPAGTDLRDFRRDADRPRLSELCARIEAAPKPVIAAIHGTALGGGLELALACHYRLARVGTQLGIPDVMLGIVPNAGGSQRLPRLVGAAGALEMLLRGHPVKAGQAERAGLIDKMIRGDFEATVLAIAQSMADAGQGPRPTSARTDGLGDPTAYLETVAARRAELADDPQIAPRKLVDLVEAALLLPFGAGLAMEHVVYEDLLAGPQARALRHVFLAERRGGRAKGARSATPREVARVAILGHGDLAAGLARTCLSGRMPIVAVEDDETRRLSLRARIIAGLASDAKAGRIAEAERQAQIDLFAQDGKLEDPETVGLVILAGDTAEAQRAAAIRAGAETVRGTVIAIPTGTADVAGLAKLSGRADDVIALHMPWPARRTRLVELSLPVAAAPDLRATGAAFARRIGRVPIVLAEAEAGTVTAALDGALFAAGEALVLSGAGFADIDAALVRAGFEMGPFERADRAKAKRLPPPGATSALAERIAATPTGRFYARPGDRTRRPEPAPEAMAAVDLLRRQAGAGPAATPDDAEILRRCLLAMANTGARLMSQGLVERVSDVDVAAVHGLGIPRWLGGPMEAVDQMGLLHARNLLRGWAAAGSLARAIWEPDALFDAMIREGRHFGDDAG